jgi:predicted component of type VI protein secretion system
MFGKKIVKRCAKGHVMELSWRRCPRCTGRSARVETGRDITEMTMISAPAAAPADETRIVMPSVSRGASVSGIAGARGASVSGAPAAPSAAPRPAAPPPPPAPAAPRSLAQLVVVAGPLAGQSFDLDPGVYRIGKQPPSGPDAKSLTITGDRFMSKVHAVLTMGTAQLVLSDPGSTNGTFVNGERVTRTVLKDGDELRMGESMFRIAMRR